LLLLGRILGSGVCRRPSGLEGDGGGGRNDSETLNTGLTRCGRLGETRPGVLTTSADGFVPAV